jgi:hypothetical protein
MSSDYSEELLVEEPAIGLFEAAGSCRCRQNP